MCPVLCSDVSASVRRVVDARASVPAKKWATAFGSVTTILLIPSGPGLMNTEPYWSAQSAIMSADLEPS
jgi:hypothetical protein